MTLQNRLDKACDAWDWRCANDLAVAAAKAALEAALEAIDNSNDEHWWYADKLRALLSELEGRR